MTTTAAVQSDGEELVLLLTNAEERAQVIYLRAIQTVLEKNPDLDHYIDAMGTQFFVRRDESIVGEVTHNEDDLPLTAFLMIREVAYPYNDAFGSPAWKVYRDRLVTEW
jgi:hypothetical protein